MDLEQYREEQEKVTENRANEALEKLNRGIQQSRQMVQQQTMQLAQDYFGDSVEEIRQQINESRATLEGLPDQVPGGQEESFQMLFQELMDNYTAIENALGEAQKNVDELDTEKLIKQGEIDATDAARREAKERGLDLTEVEGTGSDGRITVDDVKKAAEAAGEDGATGQEGAGLDLKASDAAKRRAEELGIDISQVEGTGSGGLITVKDVTNLVGETETKATDLAGQVADQATGAVDQAAGQADGAVENVEPRATSAAKRKAEELGIDISQVEGSGAGGLITIKDVTKA
jgi:pyruvate/2-oxoglutarate dehydrogenase complex dihydrolipoamide acyltransferase (E2) component